MLALLDGALLREWILLQRECPALRSGCLGLAISSGRLTKGRCSAMLCFAEFADSRGTEDGESGPAVLAACAARRWLARTAAGVKHLDELYAFSPPVCTSLVSCLPALENVQLTLVPPLTPEDLGCLLEALAWCPRLSSLHLCVRDNSNDSTDEDDDEHDAAPQKLPVLGCLPAFAKLRSLTQLELGLGEADPHTLPNMVLGLAPLTGLAELRIRCFYGPAVFPASLQMQGLRCLKFDNLDPCVFEAGCLDLPLLQSLEFYNCVVEDAAMLSDITALQSLTSIKLCSSQGPPVFAQLVHLPRLQHAVLGAYACACRGLFRLPADMGSLCATLLYMDCSRQGLTQFPQALTQLTALNCLKLDHNDFERLPVAITNLSRLTELRHGRVRGNDPLQLRAKRPLDVRALGGLSAFPALRKLDFGFCEVRLCESMLGAMRHASLESLTFYVAHPAPECALVVLQLRQTLRGLRRIVGLSLSCNAPGTLHLGALSGSL